MTPERKASGASSVSALSAARKVESRASASGTAQGRLLVELTLYSPLQALTTALFAVLALAAFREWFAIRLDA